MNLDLHDKTALVTGSSGGIGLEIARSLAAEGAKVVINGRTQASVEKAASTIGIPDTQLIPLVADNGTAAGCAKTIAHLSEVDILVNNLGIYEAVEFFDVNDESWQTFFEVNIMSGVRLARHYLQGMLKRGHGRVVFVSSESAVLPTPETAHYSATKAMQLGISRSLAELTKGTEVTVNAVLPGPTRTEGVMQFVRDAYRDLSPAEADQRFMLESCPTSLIGRLIEPKEIGDIVAFVCSARASVVNGSCIRAEGGIVRSLF